MNMPDNQPPSEIDGARAIEWAWSGDLPFGEIPGTDPSLIFGLAIATYDDRKFYRFSCDRDWETQQDAPYYSVLEPEAQVPNQYLNSEVVWHSL